MQKSHSIPSYVIGTLPSPFAFPSFYSLMPFWSISVGMVIIFNWLLQIGILSFFGFLGRRYSLVDSLYSAAIQEGANWMVLISTTLVYGILFLQPRSLFYLFVVVHPLLLQFGLLGTYTTHHNTHTHTHTHTHHTHTHTTHTQCLMVGIGLPCWWCCCLWLNWG